MKEKNILSLLLLFLLSCSKENQSSVFTETESGQKISGIVTTDKSKRASAARVCLLDTDQIITQSRPRYETWTDSNGQFHFDNVAVGNYHLLATDSLGTKMAFGKIDLSQDDDTQHPDDTLLLEATHTLLLFKKSWGITTSDTVCIAGSLTCTIVDEISEAASLSMPSRMSAPSIWIGSGTGHPARITHLKDTIGNSDFSIAIGNRILKPQLRIDFSLPDSLSQKFQKTYSNLPLPIWLPRSIATPVLIDQKGQPIPLDSSFQQGDSTLFWANTSSIGFENKSTINFWLFSIAEETDIGSSTPIRHPSFHWDSLGDSTGVYGLCKTFSSFSVADTIAFLPELATQTGTGLSIWLKIAGKSLPGKQVSLFRQFNSENSIELRQGITPTTVELSITTMNGESGTTFGNASVLDGKWHHYAYTLKDGRLQIVVDGSTIIDTTFLEGEGFVGSHTLILGMDSLVVGSFDEAFVLDGTQDAEWLELHYLATKPTSGYWDIDYP